MPTKKESIDLKVSMPDAVKGGVYSNLANIHMSKNEIILDFLFRGPHGPKDATLVSRVIISMDHAKSLEKALFGILNQKNKK
ncbi:MAG: DUF3467 domain-containing protein [Parcubacteria group bacterium]|nr:DUF3467 domain-containing protein [Parcubacteria group bacterium]